MSRDQDSHTEELRGISSQMKAVLRHLAGLIERAERVADGRNDLEQNGKFIMDIHLPAEHKTLGEYAKDTFKNYKSDSKTYVDLVKAIKSSHNTLEDQKKELDKWMRNNT